MCLLLFNIFIVLDVFKYIISIFLFVSFNIIEPMTKNNYASQNIYYLLKRTSLLFLLFFFILYEIQMY